MTPCNICLGCCYRRYVAASNPTDTACHYLLDTGRQRGCTPAACTHWRPSAAAVQLLALAEKGD